MPTRAKAEALPRVGIEDETHHLGLGVHDFVVGRRSIGLLHVPIAVGGARQHIDRALLSAVALATARTLGNLGPFVFRNHPLKLDQQLIFGASPGGRSQKDQLLCLAKISKCLSGWGLYFLHNSCRCSLLSRHSSQLCPQSSVRVLPLSSRTWLSATKSACCRGPQESARN